MGSQGLLRLPGRSARLLWMCLRTPPSLSVARRSSPPPAPRPLRRATSLRALPPPTLSRLRRVSLLMLRPLDVLLASFTGTSARGRPTLRLSTAPSPPLSRTFPTPTRGTSPGPSVTPSLTATKLKTVLRPSPRCVSRPTPTATPRASAWVFPCCKQKVPQTPKKYRISAKLEPTDTMACINCSGKITESCSGAFEETSVQKYHHVPS